MTLNIDDDVLQEVKEIAEREGITIGKALSDLARDGFFLLFDEVVLSRQERGEPMKQLPKGIVTPEHVQTIINEEWS